MKALYAGSFDCYTNGHHHIVKLASRVFDELHVVVAVNTNKQRMFPADDMVNVISKALEDDGIVNCTVCEHRGLIADYCNTHNINLLVRGLRNSMDYNYEENIAEVNKLINPNLESVYFRSDNAAISSTMVREMLTYGRDISKLVPPSVWNYLCSSKPLK